MTETFDVFSVEKKNIKIHFIWSAIMKSNYPWCPSSLMIIGLLRLQILDKSVCLLFVDQTTTFILLWKQIIQIIWISKEILASKIHLLYTHI